MRLPSVISLGKDWLVEQRLQVYVGTEALPIKAADFISSIYLSHDSEFSAEEDYRWLDVPNQISKFPVKENCLYSILYLF